MPRFVRFAALAGCGWLLDFCLLLALVRVGGVPAAAANLVSSASAAAAVFVASRTLVFDGPRGGLPARLGIYLAYTLVVILAASAAVGALAAWLASPGGVLGLRLPSAAAAAAAAKVVVTPPNLLLNFVVSRFLSERPGVRARTAHD